MSSGLFRFRLAAYVVGVLLLLLVAVAMPLKYFAGQPGLVAIIGPVHGVLYMLYLVVAFDLAVRAKWPFVRTVLILAGGVVPGLSFVMERKVTGWIRSDARTSVASAGSGI